MSLSFWPIFFILGTIVGSFANVVILRHGFKEAARSRSGCASCGEQLKWYELVPIISFALLQGRCGHCESRLLWQYPIVELLVGTLFALTFYTMFPLVSVFQVLMFVAALVFWAAFVILTVYDLRHTLVPYAFSLTLIASALAFRTFYALSFGSQQLFFEGIYGAVIFGGFLFLLYLITRGKGMGLGDGYVGVALGLLFGVIQTLEVLLLSFWIGAIVGIVLLVLKKGFKMKSEVPFVPFLFLASLIGAFTHFSAIALIAQLVHVL